MLAYPLYNKQSKKKIFGGGAAVQLYLLSKELAKNNDSDVNVVCSNDKQTNNKIELIGNIKLYKVRPIIRRLTYYFFSMINLFITLIKINPDVVIQRHADKVTGICAFYCKIFRKKFIYSIASIADVTGEREIGFLGKFYRYGINNANIIIAQNKDQILELEKTKKKSFKNISIIKNSYEIAENRIENKKHILWVSRAIGLKRPELFLKLAKEFPVEKFIMICNKTDYKIQNVRYWKAIYNKSLEISNLEFLEFVSFYKIDNYFKEARVIINTSTFEGFPNTFIQAFQNKTPVLSLKVNPENIFTDYQIGFCCNDDFDLMVKNLKKLLEDQELFMYYSENCYNYAKKYHNIRENIKFWVEIINR